MSKKILDKKDQLFDTLVADKIKEELETEYTISEDVDHDFSKLDEWFSNYIENIDEVQTRKIKKTFTMIFRLAASFLIAISVAAVAIGNNTEAFRFEIFNTFLQPKEEYTQISKVEDEQLYSSEILPVYIPEGLKLSKVIDLGSIKMTFYESATTNLTFKVSDIHTTLAFDTEDLNVIEFDELNGFYVIENSYIKAYWSDETHHYVIISNLDIEEVKKIAKSVD